MSAHDFCRVLLSVTRRDLTPEQRKRLVGAWSYTYPSYGRSVNSGEFNVRSHKDWRDTPSFYWHGGCCCAYSARTNGINAWLQKYYPETETEN